MRSQRRTGTAALAICLSASLLGAPALAHPGDSLSPAGPPSAPPPVSPVGSADARSTPWPWVFIGAGALTLGTGIWLVDKDHNDAQMPACTTSPIGRTTCPYGTSTSWQGWGFVALGAELAVAGVAWRVYEVRHANRTAKSVKVIAGLGGLGLSGTF